MLIFKLKFFMVTLWQTLWWFWNISEYFWNIQKFEDTVFFVFAQLTFLKCTFLLYNRSTWELKILNKSSDVKTDNISVLDFFIWDFLFLLVLGVSYSCYTEKRDLKKIAECDRLNHYHSKSESVRVAIPSHWTLLLIQTRVKENA